MKTIVFITLTFFMASTSLATNIQKKAPSFLDDSISIDIKLRHQTTTWEEYHPERGFFQKAYRDRSDPTFMITNEDNSFQFGIGGTIRATASYDFQGAVNHKRFVTWNIPIPTNYAESFGLNLASSSLYCKTKIKLGKENMIGFLSFETNDENNITLSQAYISYGGFSVGQTYSFFMDLAAGIENVDLRGPNTQINKTHPLIGYTHIINDRFLVAAACESPELNLFDWSEIGIWDENQSFPDFTARTTYIGDFGHLQLSGIFRTLKYWSEDKNIARSPYTDKGNTQKRFGWGTALSGRINFTPKFFMSFQGIYGKGIQEYIQDYGNTCSDLIPKPNIDKITGNKYFNMQTLPIWGGYLGLQYNFSPKFTFSTVYGRINMDTPLVKDAKGLSNDILNIIDYKRSAYLAINAFYHINNYCTLGLAYLNGKRLQRQRENYILNGKEKYGHANRFDLMFSYSF